MKREGMEEESRRRTWRNEEEGEEPRLYSVSMVVEVVKRREDQWK